MKCKICTTNDTIDEHLCSLCKTAYDVGSRDAIVGLAIAFMPTGILLIVVGIFKLLGF